MSFLLSQLVIPPTTREAYVSYQAQQLEAFGHFRKAARIRMTLVKSFGGPPNRDAIYNLVLAGADSFESGDHCTAIARWRQVLTFVHQPQWAGDAPARRGDYASAFARYLQEFAGDTIPTNAIYIDTGSIAHLRNGLRAGSRSDFASAEAEFNKSISVFPPFPWGLVMYGDVLDARHRGKEALSAWVTALRADEPDPDWPGTAMHRTAMLMLLSRNRDRC